MSTDGSPSIAALGSGVTTAQLLLARPGLATRLLFEISELDGDDGAHSADQKMNILDPLSILSLDE